MGEQEKDNGKISLDKNNYFLTKEYAEFMSKITGKKYEETNGLYHINNTLVGISSFDKKTKKKLQNEKIRYTSVEEGESMMEYAYLPTKNYEQVQKNYKRGFKIFLRRTSKQNFSHKLTKKLTNSEFNKIYDIYKNHMKRLNSFVLPKNYFQEFNKLNHSTFVLVFLDKELIAYTACFEYKNNFYCSTGGTKTKDLKTSVMNYMYDTIIKYVCKKKLQLHMGINTKGSGGDYFKKSAGFEFIPAISWPENTQFLKIANFMLKFRVTGIILRALSKRWPKKLILTILPLT